MFGISSIAGPILGGVFTQHVSWRWCKFDILLSLANLKILRLLHQPAPRGCGCGCLGLLLPPNESPRDTNAPGTKDEAPRSPWPRNLHPRSPHASSSRTMGRQSFRLEIRYRNWLVCRRGADDHSLRCLASVSRRRGQYSTKDHCQSHNYLLCHYFISWYGGHEHRHVLYSDLVPGREGRIAVDKWCSTLAHGSRKSRHVDSLRRTW